MPDRLKIFVMSKWVLGPTSGANLLGDSFAIGSQLVCTDFKAPRAHIDLMIPSSVEPEDIKIFIF